MPADIAEVALLDINDVCAAVRMSKSWWHEEVRRGAAPQPLRFGPRCSRWRASAIRQYLVDRADQPQAQAATLGSERASKASKAAQAKRAVKQSGAV